MKRWIIRSFFIGLLLLCVGGWGWSGAHGPYLVYAHGGVVAGVGTAWGAVGIGLEPVAMGWWGRMAGGIGLDYGQYRMDEVRFWPVTNMSHSFLGFRLVHGGGPGAPGWEANVPYWFLVLVFSILLDIVWRKTRPKANGRAFPVEVNKPIA